MRALLATLSVAFALHAYGQDAWPTRPVRMILPFPPGGGTDILGRLIAERLSAGIGQPVVTENRGGAGGNVGAEAAARSAPDGYTIVLVAPSLAISPTLYSKINYDPVKDFAPISLVATVPNVMVTQPSLPGQLQEFIAFVKAKPGALNFGSGGAGTSNHLRRRAFQHRHRRKTGSRALQGREPRHAGRARRQRPSRLHRHPRRGAAHQSGEAARPRRRGTATLERASRCSDGRGGRPQGLRSNHLVRHPRARRHTAAGRETAECRAREGYARAGDEGKTHRNRHRAVHQHA